MFPVSSLNVPAVFVDKGVKGADPYALPEYARWHGKNKAPNSPYQFGSMKSRGLKQAINRWTIQKGLKGVRDKKTGRFLPRKSMQFMINRSIYLSGLEASMFFTGPYNKLLDQGFLSIGCEPCTRPIKIGEDVRSGRWWWENDENKECGLHMDHNK